MKSHHKNLSKMVIREFHIEDYDEIITLWNDAQLPYKPKGRDRRDKIEYEVKQGNPIFLVAELSGKLVGSILGTHDGRKGWINRLAIAPEFRRKGIARKLVAEMEDRLSKFGIEIIACLVEDWNTESIKVFEKLEYKRHSDIVYFTKRRNFEV
ncbi:MAG: GNAT family N-acetyltransferase [Candidatus Thermoplasmatota archaeon]|nr:GNAT family N-acetyltransferase [Candidatus Thermoplasmatota archaeon]